MFDIKKTTANNSLLLQWTRTYLSLFKLQQQGETLCGISILELRLAEFRDKDRHAYLVHKHLLQDQQASRTDSRWT